MALKEYYKLLEIAPSSSSDEIKHAFRLQIARYHPDKVQHLGKEFQAMAADRAAELTEAYRILGDTRLREEYDRARGNAAPDASAPAAPPPAAPSPAAAAQSSDAPHESAPPRAQESGGASGAQFSKERASRDDFVRKATIGRFRQALIATLGAGYDESPVKGFDMACVPKGKMFSRTKNPRLLVRFVPRVDGATVGDAWAQASKWNVPEKEEICVFLIGSSIAPPRELADAIGEQRKKPLRGAKVTLIPVDQRDWEAHMPIDAPGLCKSLLAKLKSGA